MRPLSHKKAVKIIPAMIGEIIKEPDDEMESIVFCADGCGESFRLLFTGGPIEKGFKYEGVSATMQKGDSGLFELLHINSYIRDKPFSITKTLYQGQGTLYNQHQPEQRNREIKH